MEPEGSILPVTRPYLKTDELNPHTLQIYFSTTHSRNNLLSTSRS